MCQKRHLNKGLVIIWAYNMHPKVTQNSYQRVESRKWQIYLEM